MYLYLFVFYILCLQFCIPYSGALKWCSSDVKGMRTYCQVCLSDVKTETGLKTLAELKDTYGSQNVHFIRYFLLADVFHCSDNFFEEQACKPRSYTNSKLRVSDSPGLSVELWSS